LEQEIKSFLSNIHASINELTNSAQFMIYTQNKTTAELTPLPQFTDPSLIKNYPKDYSSDYVIDLTPIIPTLPPLKTDEVYVLAIKFTKDTSKKTQLVRAISPIVSFDSEILSTAKTLSPEATYFTILKMDSPIILRVNFSPYTKVSKSTMSIPPLDDPTQPSVETDVYTVQSITTDNYTIEFVEDDKPTRIIKTTFSDPSVLETYNNVQRKTLIEFMTTICNESTENLVSQLPEINRLSKNLKLREELKKLCTNVTTKEDICLKNSLVNVCGVSISDSIYNKTISCPDSFCENVSQCLQPSFNCGSSIAVALKVLVSLCFSMDCKFKDAIINDCDVINVSTNHGYDFIKCISPTDTSCEIVRRCNDTACISLLKKQFGSSFIKKPCSTNVDKDSSKDDAVVENDSEDNEDAQTDSESEDVPKKKNKKWSTGKIAVVVGVSATVIAGICGAGYAFLL